MYWEPEYWLIYVSSEAFTLLNKSLVRTVRSHVLRQCVLKGSTRIVDPDPSLQMRRLWRLSRHQYDVIVARHHPWRTNRRATGTFLLDPSNRSVSDKQCI